MVSKTLIFGHRGYPHKFPENSLKGFAYAIAHGIDGLEFDVHLTKDNVPVIMHDEKKLIEQLMGAVKFARIPSRNYGNFN